MLRLIRHLYQALRLKRRLRRLRKAWKIIRFTDTFMLDKPSWKRQEFWETFIKRHEFRNFASQKFIRDLLR
jgi:hypothetical protein